MIVCKNDMNVFNLFIRDRICQYFLQDLLKDVVPPSVMWHLYGEYLFAVQSSSFF